VHGGVVDNQRYALSYRIAFHIIDSVGLHFNPILRMVGWLGLAIQNGTRHNRFSGAAIQADSVHGGVVDNQR
jgi:hypothetical protein